jgi:hypothetical protein
MRPHRAGKPRKRKLHEKLHGKLAKKIESVRPRGGAGLSLSTNLH